MAINLGSKAGKISDIELPSGTSTSGIPEPTGDATSNEDVELIKRQIFESDFLGSIGTYFHEDDYKRLEEFYKGLDKDVEKIKTHINKELGRIEKKLKKMFKLQEKLTKKTSEKKFEAIKNGLDSKDDSVVCFGGKHDTDLGGGSESSGEIQKIITVPPPLQDNSALVMTTGYYKRKFSHANERAKSITNSIMSLLSKYQNLMRISEYIEDSENKHEVGKVYIDTAIDNKDVYPTIGPIENTTLTPTST